MATTSARVGGQSDPHRIRRLRQLADEPAEAIEEVRRICQALHAPIVGQLAFRDALALLAGRTEKSRHPTRITYRLRSELSQRAKELKPPVEMTVPNVSQALSTTRRGSSE